MLAGFSDCAAVGYGHREQGTTGAKDMTNLAQFPPNTGRTPTRPLFKGSAKRRVSVASVGNLTNAGEQDANRLPAGVNLFGVVNLPALVIPASVEHPSPDEEKAKPLSLYCFASLRLTHLRGLSLPVLNTLHPKKKGSPPLRCCVALRPPILSLTC